MDAENYLESIKKQFLYYKGLGEKAMEQTPDEKLFWQYNNESNSIATIVKHLTGNMLSRWTDFLTTDGEKPTKNKKGNRLFTQKDIENLRLIVHYVKEKGYTLQGAKEKLKKGTPEFDNVKMEVIARLKTIKDQLNEIKGKL